ncbi:hypothetical protein SCA6_003899 [Theobroma cacao]
MKNKKTDVLNKQMHDYLPLKKLGRYYFKGLRMCIRFLLDRFGALRLRCLRLKTSSKWSFATTWGKQACDLPWNRSSEILVETRN